MLNYNVNFEKLSLLLPCWTWQELDYGLNSNLLTEQDIITYAVQILSENIEQYDLILSLAIAKEDEVNELLLKLEKEEKRQNRNEIEDKWIFSIIYYAFYNDKTHLYEIIDDIYSEFDYPEQIKNLIVYMPCDDGRSMEEKVEEYITDYKKISNNT